MHLKKFQLLGFSKKLSSWPQNKQSAEITDWEAHKVAPSRAGELCVYSAATMHIIPLHKL